jgi:LuxR family maltose regulon positive regulatory protein
LLNPAPARRARLLLAQGDLAAAASFAQENGVGPDDEPDYAREPGHLVLARVLLAQTGPGRRWRCWTGCTPRRSPRTVPAP